MKKPIFSDDLRARIREDAELSGSNFVPYLMGVFLIIHADRDDSHFSLFQLFRVLRQTAQLRHAERSPISSVEIQKNPASALIRQLQNGPILILQREVRRRLAHG